MKIIFIGNPGTGKSTLLNGLIGQPIFKSGFAAGQGMTTELQLEEFGGITYGDTPGLSDVRLRQRAAEAISNALRSGTDEYKLVFVVTAESGRVRPVDSVTMKLVTDALPKEPKVPYGIIVNKISKKAMSKLTADEQKMDTFIACLNEGRENPTAYIHLYQNKEELEDEDDKLHTPTNELRAFLAMLPSIRIKPEDVKDVQASEFEALTEKYEKEMEAIRNDKKVLEEKMAKNKEEMDKQLEQLQKDHLKEMENARRGPEEGGLFGLLGKVITAALPLVFAGALS